MARLDFSLAPEACGRLYDALSCLAKFNDSITIEARASQLSISTLNSSKSAHVSFSLVATQFFSVYEFEPSPGRYGDRFSCQVLNKALLSVFKGRLVDPKSKHSGLDRCEAHLQDDGEKENRLVLKMIFKHGVTKIYKLTYEPVEPTHALFDKSRTTNQWKMHSKLLREYVEYFGTRTEQLDMYAEEGRFTLTSYTEKITNEREILKHPLQTAVTIEVADFEDFNVVDDLHVAVSVKDFKNMVIHAETLWTKVSALYSVPTKPMQFSYDGFGIQGMFTLMTSGDSRGMSVTPVSRSTTRPPQTRAGSIVKALVVSENGGQIERRVTEQQVEGRETRSRAHVAQSNGNPMARTGVMEQDSLFVQQDEGDQQWDPPDFQAEEEDTLGWDASGDYVCRILRVESPMLREKHLSYGNAIQDFRPLQSSRARLEQELFDDGGIAPTQRASQVPGLFD